MRRSARGFTLVELLVVIAIMGLVGMYVLSNYGSFGEDQKLKNAALDVASLLKTAQTNATANVKCNSQFGATWKVEFTNSTTLNLKCSLSSDSQKTLSLDKIATTITQSTTGSNCPTPPFASFEPLSGLVSFGDSRCTSLTITLTNTKATAPKSLTIEQGGRIYVQ